MIGSIEAAAAGHFNSQLSVAVDGVYLRWRWSTRQAEFMKYEFIFLFKIVVMFFVKLDTVLGFTVKLLSMSGHNLFKSRFFFSPHNTKKFLV